jgi:hypothetical protein
VVALRGNALATLPLGGATAGAATVLTPPNEPSEILTGDFDGDGVADALVLGWDGWVLARRDVSGAVQLGSLVGSGNIVGAVADLDHDGRLDVVGVNPYTGVVSLSYGNGDGTFRDGPSYAYWPPMDAFAGFALADLDCDGLLDLAYSAVPLPLHTSGELEIAFGTAGGGFATLTPQNVLAKGVLVGDIDGDSAPDLILNGPAASPSARVMRNSGNRTFLAPESVAGPVRLVGDVDGDGRADLVDPDSTGGVTVYLTRCP